MEDTNIAGSKRRAPYPRVVSNLGPEASANVRPVKLRRVSDDTFAMQNPSELGLSLDSSDDESIISISKTTLIQTSAPLQPVSFSNDEVAVDPYSASTLRPSIAASTTIVENEDETICLPPLPECKHAWDVAETHGKDAEDRKTAVKQRPNFDSNDVWVSPDFQLKPLVPRLPATEQLMTKKVEIQVAADVTKETDDLSDCETAKPNGTVEPMQNLPTQKIRASWNISRLVAIVFTVSCCILAFVKSAISQRQHPAIKDSLCVAGGGFSGFWYSLGRINSIGDPLSKHYYCYSAGCLGVVAALSNYTKDEMLDMALDAQIRWKQGTLSRYDVVGAFLDDLIHGAEHEHGVSSKLKDRIQDPRFLSSLNIITTKATKWGGLEAVVRTPTDIASLRKMLLQTTWIPYAVGKSLWHDGHMDGAFTSPLHPTCERNVGLAFDYTLLANIVNVNLGADKVEQLWNAGLAHGL